MPYEVVFQLFSTFLILQLIVFLGLSLTDDVQPCRRPLLLWHWPRPLPAPRSPPAGSFGGHCELNTIPITPLYTPAQQLVLHGPTSSVCICLFLCAFVVQQAACGRFWLSQNASESTVVHWSQWRAILQSLRVRQTKHIFNTAPNAELCPLPVTTCISVTCAGVPT
jgi:hypothetical protein